MTEWHELSARAAVDGVLTSPGAPPTLLGLPTRVFLAWVEGLLRQDEKTAKQIDGFYAAATPLQIRTADRAERIAEVQRLFA